MEIESILGGVHAGPEQLRWEAHGVECHRGRHRYSGYDYSWTIDVLFIRSRRSGRSWQLILTTEFWRSGSIDVRATKWLKLTSGKAGDVVAWISECRNQNLERPNKIGRTGGHDG